MIKKGEYWKKGRDDYRELKNGYLKKDDRNHPSCFYIQWREEYIGEHYGKNAAVVL